jgi:hypothetical protein
MTSTTGRRAVAAAPDVVLHPGRRGRVAVVRLRGADEPGQDTAARAAEQALGLRPRWVVVDLSAVAAREEAGRLLEAVRRRVQPAGVRMAVAGGHRPVSDAVADEEHGCPTFPTVPIALGTLGAI